MCYHVLYDTIINPPSSAGRRHQVDTMLSTQSPISEMLSAELRASLPQVTELLDLLAEEQSAESRRATLRRLGAHWYSQGGEPGVLAELGVALVEQYGLDAGVALAELLMAYGAAREEQRTREWEEHLVRRMAELRGLHKVISAANSTLD